MKALYATLFHPNCPCQVFKGGGAGEEKIVYNRTIESLREVSVMKVLQVGFGVFGNGWYEQIKTGHPDLAFVGVDTNPAVRERLMREGVVCYDDLTLALAREKPDFLLNVAPPIAHDAINNLAFDHGVPVLCEKPISHDFAAGAATTRRAEELGIPFMIAEPYRRNAVFREMKRLIDEGAIGCVVDVLVHFHVNYLGKKAYLTQQLPDPLLQDLAIHHMDTLRYLTAADGKRALATSHNPPGSPFAGNAAAMAIFEMEGGIRASFYGSLVSRGLSTGFHGHWRIEGTRGSMTLTDTITLENNERKTTLDISDTAEPDILSEFLQWLAAGTRPESTATDYIQSEALIHAARTSAQNRGWEPVPHAFRG